MLDMRTCYKNRLYFPLPHHLFLHKTHAACPSLPTFNSVVQFYPGLCLPSHWHIICSLIPWLDLRLRWEARPANWLRQALSVFLTFPEIISRPGLCVQKISCISWLRGDQTLGAQFIPAKLRRWANIPEYLFIHWFSISTVKQFHFSWLLY